MVFGGLNLWDGFILIADMRANYSKLFLSSESRHIESYYGEEAVFLKVNKWEEKSPLSIYRTSSLTWLVVT